jgi:hypothetical protein
MEITKKQLKQIIKEELESVLNETGLPTRYADPAAVKTMSKYQYGKLPPEEEDGSDGEGAVFVTKGKKEVWDAVQDVLSKSQGYFGHAMMAKYLQELATKVTSSEQLTGFEEGQLEEMFDMSGRRRGAGHEASHAEKRKNKKTGPDHEEKMRKEREKKRRLHQYGYEE